MVWIRRVRTASGATAVQIVESVAGRRRVVRHVGSAHNAGELGVLLAQAQAFIDDDAQGVLDIGITPRDGRFSLLPAPSVPALFDHDPRAGRTARGRAVPEVVKTSSRLLYDAVGGIYDALGFDGLGDRAFRDLVIARVVEPTSLRDVDRVLADLGQKAVSLSTRKRCLTRCSQGQYRDAIAKLCFSYTRAHGDISLVLYDVTTLYFEAEKEDELRKVGFSKERRVDPQIIVGLLVDRTGFPLEIACFEGNKAERLTIIPVIDAFKARHGLEHMVVVADAGMLSAANLAALDEAGYQFIVGSRAVKAPLDLASHFRWHGDAFTDGDIIDTVTPKQGRTSENDLNVKAEPSWDPGTHPTSWRAVWAYSTKRFVRDNATLTLQENRAQAVINGEKSARMPRFVTVKGSDRTLDTRALERARRVAGLKGYVTNMPASVMPAPEVISSYHDLWHVEQSFRMSKTDLAARPMFAHTRDAIEAHLTIVFTALAVARTIQQRTGLSLRAFNRLLRPLRSATIAVNGMYHTIDPAIDENVKEVLTLLKTPSVRH